MQLGFVELRCNTISFLATRALCSQLLVKLRRSVSQATATVMKLCNSISTDDDDDVELHVLGCRLTY